ncbi:DUF3592 domain-containing protein [Aquabacterium sp. J223]|uniref:DUF3592 domain-containing protein n=1 Tax=Aquabacterium sp. J223 TaxID=2898431 RepID=UPI0021ADBC32|nr:DUF3592 domain-containing protein [Aquabacterium sp. J223]UUX95428.1 DUF3592 domain-containing protein [Aquabacterium sp. J223]
MSVLVLVPLCVAFGVVGRDLVLLLAGTADARAWVPVSARLLHWERRSGTHQTVRGFAIRTPTHELVARYDYTFDGSRHTGEQVSLRPVRDNFSNGWRNRVAQRLAAAERGATLTVWVDPRRPDRSVIERRLPLASAVFAAVFLLFPCGVASALVLGALLRWTGPGGAAARHSRQRRWLLPLWALLHGLPVPFIVALAEPGDVGWRSGALLCGLTAIGLSGLLGVARALSTPSTPSPRATRP